MSSWQQVPSKDPGSDVLGPDSDFIGSQIQGKDACARGVVGFEGTPADDGGADEPVGHGDDSENEDREARTLG